MLINNIYNTVPRNLAALLLLICVGSSPVWGQTVNDHQVQAEIDAANKQVQRIMDRFRPHMTATQQAAVAGRRVRVIPMADFNAFVDYQRREILVPMQLVAEIAAQLEAMILVIRDPALQATYGRWLEHVRLRSESARSRFFAGQTIVDDVPFRAFWQFAGIASPAQFTSLERDTFWGGVDDALGLIIGHELGHLFLGHMPYSQITPEQSRAQEYAADEYARKIMGDAERFVFAGLVTFFARFVEAESWETGRSANGNTHPPAKCRIYRIGASELKMWSDKLDAGALKQRFSSVGDIERLLAEWRADCE